MTTFLFLLVSVFWGGSFLAINMSLKGFSPFLAASIRVAIALVITFIYIKRKKLAFPEKHIIIQATLNGMLGTGLAWVFLFWSEQYVAPALCSIINATTPIFTMLFALLLISPEQEKMTWNKWIGVVLGFLGIFVIFGPFVTSRSAQSIEGLAAVVGMAICYGAAIAWLKRISSHISNIMFLFFGCIGAQIVLIPVTIYYGITHYFVTGESILIPSLALLYLGVFSTTIAFIIFYKLMREIGLVQAASVTYVTPIVAILLDLFILKKWVGAQALFGALIIFAALRLIHRPIIRVVD